MVFLPEKATLSELHPSVLAPGVLPGLWTGEVVTVADVTPSSFIASKFAETGVKCVMLTGHNFLLQQAFMSKKLFDGMAPDLQKALLEAGTEAAAFHRKLSNDEESEILKTITEKHGVRVVGKGQGLDIDAFRRNARKIVVPEFEKVWSPILEWVDKTR